VEQDGLEEARLSKTGAQFGSTKRGIAYVYGDKYMKKTLRMGDLLHLDEAVKKRLVTMVDSKNLIMEGSYGAKPIDVEEMWAWLQKYAAIFKDYICDAGMYLDEADREGKKILFEAQLGALRDIDFGIYPYTTSSNVIGAYAPIGAGIPGHKLDNSIGIMKAYSSCVGDGPFTAELAMTEEEKHFLREAGHEYGAATGRPRRVGPVDLVASRYLPLERRHPHRPLPDGRGTGHRAARGRVSARLALRHHRRPPLGGSAQGGAGLHPGPRKGRELQDHLHLGGRRARGLYPSYLSVSATA
jgi:adenylosuccinate synthase